MGNWSNLPEDVLVLILEKSAAPDCIRVGAVCVSWNLILRKTKHYLRIHESSSPWLMLPLGDNRANFFSLSENKTYRIPLPGTIPNLRSHICYGSSHGWLITVDQTSQMHLINPLTGAQQQLPPLDTLPFVDAVRDSQGQVTEFSVLDDLHYVETTDPEHMRHRFTNLKHMRSFFFQKAILSSAPSTSDFNSSSGNPFTVMIIHNPDGRLAFTRAGDKTWSALRTRDAFDDIIHLNGRFYAVTSCSGKVYVWDPSRSGDGFELKLAIGNRGIIKRDIGNMSYYLVESLTGKLMMVMRDRDYVRRSLLHTLEFKVLRLLNRHRDKKTGLVHKKWSYVKEDMGDDVIFLGNNHSVSISASKFPELRRNCIYFTDDYFMAIQLYKRNKRDVGLYDMGDKTIKLIDSLPSHFKWPPPVWLIPSLL